MVERLTRGELRSWYRLIRGIRALLQALDRQLRDQAGISHDDYEILGRLHRAQDRTMRMSTLAREVGFSPSRLSHAVARMEDSGWVARAVGATDRRVVEVHLTAAGVDMVEEVSVGHLGLVKRLVFDTLGLDEARRVSESMDRIHRIAESGNRPAGLGSGSWGEDSYDQ